ncbi:MAG: hypothetical protein KA387_07015 [Rubrivivax sp.]|nr:hypothetical protein [Rubrivivax sp.]
MNIIPSFTRSLASLTLALSLPFAAAGQAGEAGEALGFSRVGRIVDLQGDVALYDPQADEWTEALRNRPLVAGDRLVLQRSARAELRVGSTVLLLGQGADLAVDALDDDRLRLTLNAGSLALRLASRDAAESTEVRTVAALIRPQRAGQYRIDQDEDSTFAATWRGALEVSGQGHLLLIGPGERHEIWLDTRQGTARSRVARLPGDRLAAWAETRFAEEDAAPQAWRYASPAIPGLEDLDRHGRWDSHPEYGAVWVPYGVSARWAPFTDGRWVWMRPWGWTWVDAQPWGFAPSYYGRWLQWHGHWAWWPGQRQLRPVFAPAVVAWVGGSHVGVGISIGAQPPMAWVPLQPWQPYVPIIAPRPPHHRGSPPYRLPPPHEPTSRQARDAAGGSAAAPATRPLPRGSVQYGTQGVPVNVNTAPAARTLPPAAAPRPGTAAAPVAPIPPAARPMPPAPAAPRAPVPESRPRSEPPAGQGVTTAPFSAPRAGAPRVEAPNAEAPRAESPRPEPPRPAPERRDSRADPRPREQPR